jgi:hypothetical protein
MTGCNSTHLRTTFFSKNRVVAMVLHFRPTTYIVAMAAASVLGNNIVSSEVLVATRHDINSNHYTNNNEAFSSRKSNDYHVHRLMQKNVNEADRAEDEMMVVKQSLPDEINVDPRSTYNEKFMALMNSPCRPELDGYFGATSGDSIRIQYGFELEIEPLSDILTLLDVLENVVVDAILTNTFPEMCGLRRHRRLTKERTTRNLARDRNKEKTKESAHVDEHPSGFHFIKFEEVGTLAINQNQKAVSVLLL